MVITPLYIALYALFFVLLSANVIRSRARAKVALGHEEAHHLLPPVRAQGNFAEYAPIFLLLLYTAEMQNMRHLALHGFGLVFLLGRLMHAYSLLKAETYRDGKLTSTVKWRIRGMVCTLGCIAGLAVCVLIFALEVSYHLGTRLW